MTEGVVIDSEHYDMIIATATRTEHIEKTLDGIAEKLAACPCPAVTGLRSDVDALQQDAANLKGRFAVIVSALGVLAGWIGSLLPGLVGGR